jgi:tetratricopeptide (TPR) repeat protein
VSNSVDNRMSDWRRQIAALVTWLVPTRTYVVWVGVLVVAALAMAVAPLFQLVGYESAAATGVIWGIGTVFATLHARGAGLVEGPLDEKGGIDSFGGLLLRHWAFLLIPLAILGLNSFRIRTCDPWGGLAFWALIPSISVLIGQTIGWVVDAVVPDHRLARWGAACAVVGLSIAALLLHLALQPPIVGHQWFLGYFSGSIYDEALAVPNSLIAYRAINVCAVVAVLAVLEGVRRSRLGGSLAWTLAVGVVATSGLLGLWWNAHDFGIGIDRDYITTNTLEGRRETEHFVIHYPENSSFLERIDRLAEDHEYRYGEMKAFFRTDPAADRKIHSYVYPDRETKGRMMGGRRTMVAKIWLGEMHVLWPRYGHHWLAHEMAHLFTAPFGAGPLSLSVQNGVGVNMGLVEGIATAADWPAENLTPHEASAALRSLELAPDIRNIVGAAGFWAQSSGRAYTLTGSFIRFLVERYGIERFKQAYAHGDFRGAYGMSVDELVGQWESFVDDWTLDERTLELAEYQYRQPSIFAKVCARSTSEVRRRARIAASREDVAQVRRLYTRLIDFSPRRMEYRIEFVRQLLQIGQVEEAARRASDVEVDSLAPVQRARVLQLRGDVAWHRGRYDEAASHYKECLETGLPWGFRRLVQVKRDAIRQSNDRIRTLSYQYFLKDPQNSVAMYFPMAWLREAPESALAQYLTGRRLWQGREFVEAVSHLEPSVAGLDSAALRWEARWLLGRSLYRVGRLGEARRVFNVLEGADSEAYRLRAREWIVRIDWLQETGRADESGNRTSPN